MKSEGVIREANNLSVGYLSNVVLVLESRYVAAEGRNVAKSRFCLDYRKVNQDMLMTHWQELSHILINHMADERNVDTD